jgi:hypothetical protein
MTLLDVTTTSRMKLLRIPISITKPSINSRIAIIGFVVQVALRDPPIRQRLC